MAIWRPAAGARNGCGSPCVVIAWWPGLDGGRGQGEGERGQQGGLRGQPQQGLRNEGQRRGQGEHQRHRPPGEEGPQHQVEPRAAGAWLAHNLVADAGGSIQLSNPESETLLIGVRLPRR